MNVSLLKTNVLKNINQDPGNIFYRCVEDSNEAIMITDKMGTLVYVNPAWQDIYGYTWEEAMGKTPTLLRSHRQTSDFYQKMWQEILDPEIACWKGELINRKKSGAEVPVLLTITPFRLNGQIQGYMGMAVDMTEKRAMEAQILQQDRLATVGLLASGIAHEIGTPLGVVRGRSEIIKMQHKDDKNISAALDIVIQQIDRVSKLITSLLNLGRSHSGAGGQVNIKSATDEAVLLLAQKLRENKIEVINDIQENLVAKISHSKFEQVILNLFINSIHAIQTKNRTDNTSTQQIILRAWEKNNHIYMQVTDTGCGIAQENISDIFKPFYTTKPLGEGTGLGLSITAQIIQEAEGQIHVESQKNIGTTFTLQIPAHRPHLV